MDTFCLDPGSLPGGQDFFIMRKRIEKIKNKKWNKKRRKKRNLQSAICHWGIKEPKERIT